jgi:hypothetical protein
MSLSGRRPGKGERGSATSFRFQIGLPVLRFALSIRFPYTLSFLNRFHGAWSSRFKPRSKFSLRRAVLVKHRYQESRDHKDHICHYTNC